MKEQLRAFRRRASPVVAAAIRTVGRWLGMYLDDLLLLAASGCFVSAVNGLLGGEWAKVMAGVALLLYAVIVARAKKGGGS